MLILRRQKTVGYTSWQGTYGEGNAIVSCQEVYDPLRHSPLQVKISRGRSHGEYSVCG